MDITHYYRVSAIASKLKQQQAPTPATVSNSIATATSNVSFTSSSISIATATSTTSSNTTLGLSALTHSKLKLQPTSPTTSTSTTTSNSPLMNSTPVQQSISTKSSYSQLLVDVQNWILWNENEDLKCLQEIQSKWKGKYYYPKQHEVEQASRLAFRGHLTKVEYMNLRSLNLTNIPGDLMAELTKCVKKLIWIREGFKKKKKKKKKKI